MENSKRTISASGGSGPLQMILELDTGRYDSKDVVPAFSLFPEGGKTRGSVPVRTLC